MIALHGKAALALILFAVVLLTARSHAQEPQRKANPARAQASATPPTEPANDEVIKINTNLVQVDAVVTDRQGRQVTDLKAGDFEIVEEGKTRSPEFFSYVPLGSLGSDKSSSGHPSAQELRRVFVFVVSNPIIEFAFSSAGANGGAPRSGGFNTQALAQRAADNARSLLTWFVDTQMTDLDLAAIADTDVDLGVLASFTNDRDVLHAAIKEVRENSSNGRSPTIRVMGSGSDISLQPLVKQNLRMIETLENVISEVERLPGRKVVTLVARGMLFNPNLPYSEVLRAHVQKLIDRANRAQIALYTVQTRDLSPNGGNIGNDGLINLARQTGGRAIYNTNDLRVGFANVIEENRGYYLLAYNPGAEASGRPHRLQIRVKRPGVNVLTRSEAFARNSSAASEAAANPFDLPLTSTGIKVTIDPSVTKTDRITRIVTSSNIDLAQVETRAQDDGSQSFSLELSIRVAGPDGHLLKQADRKVSFNAKGNDLEIARREGLLSKFEIEADKPGFYRITVAVRDDNSGRRGSRVRFFEVSRSVMSK
jgi:VWFA-related protein